MNKKKQTVVVGLSGGIDSSVSAYLLKQQGFNVIGLFMKNWDDDEDDICPASQDYEDVLLVSKQLGIPCYTVNFEKEYWDKVFNVFLQEYKSGRTPNPDLLCNKEIKFKSFLEHSLKLGADFIATGHYVRKLSTPSGYKLLRGCDSNKDQSYFLCLLNQYQLSKVIFPLGDMPKTEVKALAKEIGLPNANKKESMGICFVGKKNLKDFLGKYLNSTPGPIKTLEGKVKAKHLGLLHYTIGQRQGLGIGGPGEPWFVIGKDLENNTLFVQQGEDALPLHSDQLHSQSFHWITPLEDNFPISCTAKFRYRQQDQQVEVTPLGRHGICVSFKEPVKAVTPGQAVVLYKEDQCLGGGTIDCVFFQGKRLLYAEGKSPQSTQIEF
jgi:tRNA-uridine 2-sulfurtransferase